MGKPKMEPDRYQKHHAAYVIGLFCLLASIGLFALSLFLMPYLFFDWQYNVPDYVVYLNAKLQENYMLTQRTVAWGLCLILDFPAIILFLIADILSNKIDNKIYEAQNITSGSIYNQNDHPGLPNPNRDSARLIFKIILIIVFIFILAELFQVIIANNFRK